MRYWRPITAIREADLDGNPATEKDAAWEALLPNPPFPEYTSGHSTFSSAAATVLAGFFGSDNIAFTTGSEGVPAFLRKYHSFSEARNQHAGRVRSPELAAPTRRAFRKRRGADASRRTPKLPARLAPTP